MYEPTRADKVQSEKVAWLWEERIPRKMITIVGGRPDQGKGLFCAFLAAHVSKSKYKGRDGKMRYGRVLYSAIEDSHSLMTRPRLEAAGARMAGIDLTRFRLPVHENELRWWLENREVDLVVIDPLASHLSNGVSRHSDNIRKVTDPLSEMIEATNTACVVVEHVLKRVPQSGHPIASIGGTGSGIIAASRMAFLFGIDPSDEDHRILACVKHNIREKPMEVAFELDVREVSRVGEVPALILDGETNFDPMRMLAVKHERRIGRPPDKRAACCEWLAVYLFEAFHYGLPAIKGSKKIPAGPVPAARVFEDGLQAGWSNKTLRRACADMKIVRTGPDGKPASGGPLIRWQLPNEMQALMDGANGLADEDTPFDGDGNNSEAEAEAEVDDIEKGIAELLGGTE